MRLQSKRFRLESLLPVLFALFLLNTCGVGRVWAESSLPDFSTLRTWIQEMKTAPRGPFSQIRWFCKDGSVHPPRPYGCREHGGGVQHGDWAERAQQLRAGGYKVANILADFDPHIFKNDPAYAETFNQILLEQFLIAFDDGWIMRRARFYRGALQAEGETKGARRLLLTLVDQPVWLTRWFTRLRIGARLLAHGQDTPSVASIRQHSATLAQKDPGFAPVRNKIHIRPDQQDADRVRKYASTIIGQALAAEYEKLAQTIDAVYTAPPLVTQLESVAHKLSGAPDLAQLLLDNTADLSGGQQNAARRFRTTGRLMAAVRRALPEIQGVQNRLAAIDLSLALEVEHFAAATVLRDQLPGTTRRQRLAWLAAAAEAAFGAGFLSTREHDALGTSFQRLQSPTISLQTYKTEMDYLARVPGWGSQGLRFHFAATVQHLLPIEPLANLFMPDLLRGSPLFFYAMVLDGLLQDANRLTGVRHELLGKPVGAGLRPLNPGLARGVLHVAQDVAQDTGRESAFEQDGIYLLPETIADLPPVAGILTAGEGNPLSHIQLLARNLGIPNVGIDENLIPQLAQHAGKRVVLAVSPAGSIQLSEDNEQWASLFDRNTADQSPLIRPNLEKLNLHSADLMPLSKLRASDSGRTVGPKAANLGELYHHYPDAVANGLAIPFGVFRSLLDQPMQAQGQSVFDWMVDRYASLRTLEPGSAAHRKATDAFRQQLQEWVARADPGSDFRSRLRQAMEQVFGRDGTYGVFVRSDTNVEDLPGFTGAGLNLTVPNVVGFDNILRAISQVWASPFSARAFAWRQAHMGQPEHVYPAVLLMRSVAAEKSGVLVTQDIDTGETGWLSVAVNEGVGGAVDGQAAESLRIHMDSGMVRLLAQASAPMRRVLLPSGGMAQAPVSDEPAILRPEEIKQLIALVGELPQRFPSLTNEHGEPAPADIEFGFLKGKLVLFQIRPFLESRRAKSSLFLASLDQGLKQGLDQGLDQGVRKNEIHHIDLDARPIADVP